MPVYEPEPEPEPAPLPKAEDTPLSQADLDNLFGGADTAPPPLTSMIGDNIDGDKAETIHIEVEDLPEAEPIPEVFTGPAPRRKDDDDEIPVGRPRFKQPQPEKKGGALKIVLVLFALLFIGAAGFIFLGKNIIIGMYPPAKDLYVQYGLYTPEPGEGLNPQDIKPARDVRNGIDYLIVEGKIVNITDQAIAVPPLRVSLTNPDGKVVASQIMELGKAELQAGESYPFKAEFENPPGTARQMTVDFVGPDETANEGGAQ